MTGSLINNLMGATVPVEPEIGMGATRLGYTDRYPYTVVEVCSRWVCQVQVQG